MRGLNFRLLATSWLALLVAPASGAEITQIVSPNALSDVILEGKIELGDYDKLLSPHSPDDALS